MRKKTVRLTTMEHFELRTWMKENSERVWAMGDKGLVDLLSKELQIENLNTSHVKYARKDLGFYAKRQKTAESETLEAIETIREALISLYERLGEAPPEELLSLRQ